MDMGSTMGIELDQESALSIKSAMNTGSIIGDTLGSGEGVAGELSDH